MTQRLLLCIVTGWIYLAAAAQDLGKLIENAYTFDERFPRETVYLHTDNASYIQGDTLWYKAFVVRASTLRPDSTLSRTLYVELLNDAGALLERSTLRLDSIGQAHGNFALTPPLQNGFYEIRAYTRAMTNWFGEKDEGARGYFSRVFPLFELPRKAQPGDFTQLDIQRPEAEQDFPLSHERPYDFGKKKDRRIEFFPEGGRLAAGTRANIAYRLTDGHGMPTKDSIAVYSAAGTLLCKSTPEYEGMGSFVLQLPVAGNNAMGDAYVQIMGKHEKHPLPPMSKGAVALHAYEALDEDTGAPVVNIDLQPAAGMVALDDNGDEVPLRIAVVAFHREVPYKVYPLDLFEGISTLVVDRKDFKAGVNRLEVVDADGQSLASRMLYVAQESADTDAHKPIVTVRQNAESYEAFDPIAIELELKDENGTPLPFTELSVSVRDERGDLILDDQPSLSTQLNFCSELQGYVPPSSLPVIEALQTPQAAGHLSSYRQGAKRGVDLLMQVQGWRPETMEQLCMTDSFDVRQPMEDGPIIRGCIVKDNDKRKPYANARLDITMYNGDWHVLSSQTTADDMGVFKFETHKDFVGDFTTQFTVKDDDEKNKWSRVMIDQWYSPKAKKYNAYEMALKQPKRAAPAIAQQDEPDKADKLFEWTDTIPRTVNLKLGEAVVKKKRFVFELTGQEFDRYTYGGGEAQGKRHSDTYINVDLELQHLLDNGYETFSMMDFIYHILGKGRIAQNSAEQYLHEENKSSFDNDQPSGGTNSNYDDKAVQSWADEYKYKQRNDDKYDVQLGSLTIRASIPFYMRNDDGEVLPTFIRLDNGKLFLLTFNNFSDIPVNQFNESCPEQIKSIIISYDKTWADHLNFLHGINCETPLDGIVYVYTRPDWYNFRHVKGIQKRTLHGYQEPAGFEGPDYRRSDPENPEDYRRTLYWNPRLTTDANGKATAIFYANARWRQNIRITVRGITADGRLIEYDR